MSERPNSPEPMVLRPPLLPYPHRPVRRIVDDAARFFERSAEHLGPVVLYNMRLAYAHALYVASAAISREHADTGDLSRAAEIIENGHASS